MIEKVDLSQNEIGEKWLYVNKVLIEEIVIGAKVIEIDLSYNKITD
jgi:carbamoylphosphate synthase large subunit